MSGGKIDFVEFINGRLKDVLMRHLPRGGLFPTGIQGVFIARCDDTGITEHRFDRPIVSLLVQGTKKTLIGSCEYVLEPNQVLTIGLDMPSSSLLLDATPEKPLLTIFFDIDQKIVGDLLLEIGWKANHGLSPAGVSVSDANEDFMEAMFRLASMMDKPGQIPVRSGIILRELHYLLLVGPQKDVMMNLYGNGSCGSRIFAAIEHLKAHLNLPVRSETLANAVHMSESSLYRHFKLLTGLSPHQYHKHLRLHEARRLILTENEQAAIAAMKVGYESVTQFNREYKRLFGLPPYRSKKQNQ